jgi:AcrR family transcriptional regulator
MAKKKSTPQGEPKYHHGDLRRAIMDAAIELIAEAGVHNLSLREVARKIGVTTGAPYHHFKDRETLLLQIGVRGYAELLRRLEVARGEDKSGLEELEAESRAYLHFAREHPELYAVMFTGEVANKPECPELKATADLCYGVVWSSVARCSRLREKESAEAALCIWATLHGLIVLDQNKFLLETWPEQERVAIRGVLAIVGGFVPARLQIKESPDL